MTGFKQGVNSNGEVLRDFYVEHDPVDLYCDPDEGMTRQEFKDECDINVMLKGYEKRWNDFLRIPPAWESMQFADVSQVPDLAAALDMLHQAETAFMSLPATVRREFENDPVSFVTFAQDPANIDRLREWGLAKPKTEPVAAPVAAGAPPAPPPGAPPKTPSGGAGEAS